jgi:hypothetical protein
MGRNLIWEWRLTLPSFGLANRQKHIYFRTIFSLEYGYPAVWLRDF